MSPLQIEILNETFVKGYFVLATCLCATVTPLRSETILQKEEKIYLNVV